jgi:hypothetical protein
MLAQGSFFGNQAVLKGECIGLVKEFFYDSAAGQN